jgi:hypothetical protein
MASVYLRVRREPMPEGARVVERKGKRVAEWTDAAGRKHRAPVSTAKSSTARMERHGSFRRLRLKLWGRS